MSVRGFGDAYAIQRLLWVLVGTVIVPTVLLAVYGVWAIRNHRSAVIESIRSEQLLHLEEVARKTFEQIERLDGDARKQCAPVLLPSPEGQVCSVVGVGRVWVWGRDDAIPAELAGLGIPSSVDVSPRWFIPADASDPIRVRRASEDFEQGAVNIAWRLDMQRLSTFAEQVGTTDRASVSLEQSRSGDPAFRLEEFLPGSGLVIRLPLDRPLAQWRLTARLVDGALEAGFFGRSAWLYSLGLIVLVATVLIGTFITLSSANREIKLSRLQTDFVSSVSHELRTPLTSIRMFVEMLQSGRLEDEARAREALDLLAQETERLSRMIERVLEWAKMEAGRRSYDKELVAPSELVEEALLALKTQNLFGDNVEEIAVHVPDGLPEVPVDRDAIVEATLNLLQNALKYTPPPRSIEVEAGVYRGKLYIAVRDNGPGISRAHRKRVFEKFYQAHALLSSPHQGSGLGLAIVRAVVQGHGGRVELDSEIGRGSCFTIWLPLGTRGG